MLHMYCSLTWSQDLESLLYCLYRVFSWLSISDQMLIGVFYWKNYITVHFIILIDRGSYNLRKIELQNQSTIVQEVFLIIKPLYKIQTFQTGSGFKSQFFNTFDHVMNASQNSGQ